MPASPHIVNFYVQWAVLNLRVLHTHKNKHCIMGLKQWANKSSLCQINIQNDLIFFYIHGTNNQSLLKLPGWLSEGYGKGYRIYTGFRNALHNTCMVVQNFCWVTLQKSHVWTLKYGHWGHMEMICNFKFLWSKNLLCCRYFPDRSLITVASRVLISLKMNEIRSAPLTSTTKLNVQDSRNRQTAGQR